MPEAKLYLRNDRFTRYMRNQKNRKFRKNEAKSAVEGLSEVSHLPLDQENNETPRMKKDKTNINNGRSKSFMSQ